MKFEWVHLKDGQLINGMEFHEFTLMIHYSDGNSFPMGSPFCLGHGLIGIVESEEEEL